MELVIITSSKKKDLLENNLVRSVLAPFKPTPKVEPLYLNDKCYHYLHVDDDAPLDSIIKTLMQIDGIESVYEKPLDFPPM
ncbi:hypothetical protein [Arenibacter latericius]|uniref:hypothetical protein n=1 Tax=Arenibacter latericius TaxID=86104 RepID=UPI000429EBC3|nr:hypothetical protein [Arenibacter latericius]MDX1363372.1 hypothetical protein [Arenibacter latericius]